MRVAAAGRLRGTWDTSLGTWQTPAIAAVLQPRSWLQPGFKAQVSMEQHTDMQTHRHLGQGTSALGLRAGAALELGVPELGNMLPILEQKWGPLGSPQPYLETWLSRSSPPLLQSGVQSPEGEVS